MCSTWRPIYNAWNLVLMIDLLQCLGARRLQSRTFLLQSRSFKGKNFLPQDGQLWHQGALLYHLPKLQSVWGAVSVGLAAQGKQTPSST